MKEASIREVYEETNIQQTDYNFQLGKDNEPILSPLCENAIIAPILLYPGPVRSIMIESTPG